MSGEPIVRLADGSMVECPASLTNLVLPGDNSCLGARIAGDPLLGPLADNGGPVPTLLPGAGSPAVDALVGVHCPATDARGLPRPALGGCDIGAVEVQPTPVSAGAGGSVGAAGGGPASATASPGLASASRSAAVKTAPKPARTRPLKHLNALITLHFALSAGKVHVVLLRAARLVPGAHLQLSCLRGCSLHKGLRVHSKHLDLTGLFAGHTLSPRAAIAVRVTKAHAIGRVILLTITGTASTVRDCQLTQAGKTTHCATK